LKVSPINAEFDGGSTEIVVVDSENPIFMTCVIAYVISVVTSTNHNTFSFLILFLAMRSIFITILDSVVYECCSLFELYNILNDFSIMVSSCNQENFFYWVVFSSEPQRAREVSKSSDLFLKHAQGKNIVIKDFRNSFFPYIAIGIKEYFEQIKQEFYPDLIFTHYRNDLHQDHRLISELTWNTFRDHLILEYEIPKYDGDLGSPNFFIHLNEPICHRKIQYILDSFRTQLEKPWFTEETFLSILRLRGIESNSPSKYAEAFYSRKMVLLAEEH